LVATPMRTGDRDAEGGRRTGDRTDRDVTLTEGDRSTRLSLIPSPSIRASPVALHRLTFSASPIVSRVRQRSVSHRHAAHPPSSHPLVVSVSLLHSLHHPLIPMRFVDSCLILPFSVPTPSCSCLLVFPIKERGGSPSIHFGPGQPRMVDPGLP
jgi:hypothetical protein